MTEKRNNVSRLDTQTDFGVILLKLFEITNNEIYLKSASQIVLGILKYHRYNSSYLEFVDLSDNKLDLTQNIIETKYLFLLIKFLLLYVEVVDNKRSIYNNTILKDIIRDR